MDQSYLFIFIRPKLRFRIIIRDIPPLLPQQHGSVWISMNLNGLCTNVLSAVFSKKPGKIKDSGENVRSPIYGAGEQNHFCRLQYFQRFQSLCSDFLQLLTHFSHYYHDDASGISSENVLPFSGALATDTLPPWNSAISFTMARPSPLLPFSPREGSACQNLCQILS